MLLTCQLTSEFESNIMNEKDGLFHESSDDDEGIIDIRKLVEKYKSQNIRIEETDLIREEMLSLFCQLKQSTSDQNNAINALRVHIPKGFVKPSMMPKNFVQEYVDLFINQRTDIYIKAALLSLSDDMMKYCVDFVQEFGQELYYSKVYEEMRRGKFYIDQCLPVLNHFILHYSVAYTYFINRGFLEFIYEKLNTEKGKSSLFALYKTMECFTGSDKFPLMGNKDLMYQIVDHCIGKIIPSTKEKTFIELETQILVPVIKTLTNLIIPIGNAELYKNKIIDQCVSVFILSIINEENLEISIAGTEFLCSATFYSDEICMQLQKIGVVQYFSKSMQNDEFFSKCGLNCLRIIYNVLVSCSNNGQEMQTYIFVCAKNEDFTSVLNKVMNIGSAKMKNDVFSILATIIYFLEPNDSIAFEKFFELHDYFPVMFNYDQNPQDIFNHLMIAQKLTRVCDISPFCSQQLSEFRMIMLSEEMVDSLNNIKLHGPSQELVPYVDQLLEWINDNSPK